MASGIIPCIYFANNLTELENNLLLSVMMSGLPSFCLEELSVFCPYTACVLTACYVSAVNNEGSTWSNGIDRTLRPCGEFLVSERL